MRQVLKKVVGLSPSLSVHLRRRKERRARLRPFVSTRHGFRFAGNPLMESGAFEPVETGIVRRLLPHFDQFVNVGANIGYYCCHALQLGVRTMAFEPSRSNLDMLLANITENGWQDRIEVFPLALSDAPGILNFYGEGTGASLVAGWAGVPESYVTRVPVSTLDLVVGHRLDASRSLFLVDVEGAELSMLRGAMHQISHNPFAAWMIEICISEHLPAGQKINAQLLDTFDLFWSHGYQSYTADGTAREITQEMIERVMHTGHDDVGTHNFMFLPKTASTDLLSALRSTSS